MSSSCRLREADVLSLLLSVRLPSPTVSFPSGSVCHECGKAFSSKTRFRAHLRRHSSKTSGRYQCKQCDKNFVQRSSLTTHMRIHTGERPFKCTDCPDSFGDYSTYTKHQRTHTGEKPYTCPVCARKFSQSGNMHRHLKSVHQRDLRTVPSSPSLLSCLTGQPPAAVLPY